MGADDDPVRIPVEFFFDYRCPHCHETNRRLDQVAAAHPMAVHYRFVETRPFRRTGGREPVGAPDETRAEPSAGPSRLAIRLAQTVLDQRPDRFPALHRALFRARFSSGWDIADREVLIGLAQYLQVADLLADAWERTHCLERLLEHVQAAQRLRLTALPTLVVAGRPFSGVGAVDTLEAALKMAGGRSEGDDRPA